jgi:hypothetical protein
MNDNEERERLEVLLNMLMKAVARSHRLVGEHMPAYKLDELASITKDIAETEVAINRLLHPEAMETFAA